MKPFSQGIRKTFILLTITFVAIQAYSDPYRGTLCNPLCMNYVSLSSPFYLCETGSASTLTIYARDPNGFYSCQFPTYQWYKNPSQCCSGPPGGPIYCGPGWCPEPISDETSNSYLVTEPGEYFCRVTCGGSSYDTDVIEFKTHASTPVFSVQPEDPLEACENDAVSFTVSANNTQNYTWYERSPGGSWSNTGVESNTLNLTATANKDGYEYRAYAYGGCGGLYSNTGELSVTVPPSWTSNTNQTRTVCIGESVSFSVAASGTALQYQWYFDGNEISGATSSTYSNNNVKLADAGVYTCMVSNASKDCGSITSNNKTLVVKTQVAATTSVQPETVCVGETADFSISVTGSTPITYQWQVNKNDGAGMVDLPGETGSSLSFPGTADQDGYKYQCLATNVCNTVGDGEEASLTVNSPVVITEQTDELERCEGTSGTIEVTATGTSPGYQWYKNDEIIPAATSSSYTNSNLQPGDSGNYTCSVSNMCNIVESDSIHITVNTPVTIQSSPVDKQVCEELDVAFSTSVEGSDPVSYQWQKSIDGGSNWGDMAGENSTGLTLTADPDYDGYKYRCLASNACASNVSSDPALLTVNLNPLLTGSPEDKYICIDGNTTFSGSGTGTGIAYQWQVSEDTAKTWSDITNTGIYSNATTSTLTITAGPQSANGFLFRIEISGSCGDAVYSDTAGLFVQTGPEIVTHPASAEVCEGDAVTLTVAANGQEPLEYRWFKGGAAVTGWADQNFYIMDPVTLSDNEKFEVVVRNDCSPGGVESEDATLVVNPKPYISLGPDLHICTGDSQIINAGSGYSSYAWNSGETTQYLTVSDQGSYSVTVADAKGCTNSDDIYIILDPQLPDIDLGGDADYCPQPVMLDAGTGFDSYTWSDGSSLQSFDVKQTGTFYVTASRNNTVCKTSDTVDIRITRPYDNEQICIVTIDMATGKNMVIWEKTEDVGTAGYRIYREKTIGNYELIGQVMNPEISIFKDLSVSPENQSYIYKITSVDTCGNESEIGSVPYHKPIFLKYAGSENGINLEWTNYAIEGVTDLGDYLTSFEIWRGTDSLGLSLYKEVGSINNYTDTDPLAQKIRFYYRVAGVLKDPCSPSGDKKAGTGPYQHSLSNMDDNKLKADSTADSTAVAVWNPMAGEGLTIFPNPFSDVTTVRFFNPEKESYRLILIDLSGKIVRMRDGIREEEFQLSREGLKPGYYHLQLVGRKVFRGKMVVD